jgi:hypothetical protein
MAHAVPQILAVLHVEQHRRSIATDVKVISRNALGSLAKEHEERKTWKTL